MGCRWRSFGVRLLSLLLLLAIFTLLLAIGTKPTTTGDPGVSAPTASATRRARLATAPVSAAAVEGGRRLYDVYCWSCHGTEGRGDGPLAQDLSIQPRDFTKAQYKVRSTPHGALPSDDDLFRTITRGVPATHMPGWHTLSEQDRWQLVAFIKTFSERFRTVGAPLSLTEKHSSTGDAAAVKRGRQVLERVKCWLCHGKEGRGDGPITTALIRQWGMPYQARNLRDGASYKGGSTAQDIYRTITTGFNGTPMGAYEQLIGEEQRWDVARYVASIADRNVARKELVESGVSWQRGRWVFFGKGRCILCHRIEGKGKVTRGPDLTQIGIVAATRRKEQTPEQYLFESITKPAAFLVPEYGEHMPKINEESIFLEPDEIRSLVVYLAAQGKDATPDRQRLASLPQPKAAAADATVLPKFAGDPARGREVYYDEKAACFKCHTLHDRGDTIGPDITNLVSFQSRRQVIESLEEPNKVITHGYNEFGVITVDEDTFVGVMVYQDSREIHLANVQGEVRVIQRDEIDELIPRKVSNMPTGLLRQLGKQDYADLVAFLLDQQPELDSRFHVERPQPFVNPFKRPKNGPPLRNVVHKVGRTWLAGWLKNPQHHDPDTFMPNLQLTDDEIKAITAYLTAVADADFPRHDWPLYFSKSFDDLSGEEFEALDEEIAKGKTLWSESRCSICHKVGDRGGIVGHAPALTSAAAKLRRDWLVYWLEDPRYYFRATQMPHFRFSPDERKSLTAYLLKGDEFGGFDVEQTPDDDPVVTKPEQAVPRFEQLTPLVSRGRDVIQRSRCVVCHDIPGIPDVLDARLAWPEPRNDFELLVRDGRCLTCHAINGNGGSFAPDLTNVGSRLRRDWLQKFLVKPDIIRPMLKQMPKLKLTEAEARTVADYAKRSLTDSRIDPAFLAGNKPTPEEIQNGRQLYETKGCVACHQIGDSGGAVGPTLTFVANRLEPGYLYQYLKDPQQFKPDVVEPNYGFTDREAMALTKYLLSLKHEAQGDE